MKIATLFLAVSSCNGFVPQQTGISSSAVLKASANSDDLGVASRRTFLETTAASAVMGSLFSTVAAPQSAEAIGPVKVGVEPISYSAVICPPNKPIPGQKAMVGMKGLCVTVEANLKDDVPKELIKAGVYGFVKDGVTGDSVLANNPDLSTDAGQFAMIELVKPGDKKVTFEFIAAVPKEKDISQYSDGIGPLDFEGLRIISFPGGQQFGEINPCEMNEFSDECEAWEAENGPYQKQEYMVKGNPRTKGR